MQLLLSVVLVYTCTKFIVCPPVTPPKPVEGGSEADTNYDTGLEYDKYLREVVQVLEQDEEFRKKLEQSNATDVKSGSIAYHLEFVSHHVREKLDELKRRELHRLRELVRDQIKKNGVDGLNEHAPAHIDVNNPHSFEVDDLKKLITKTTSDLEDIDKKRRQRFKEYEMQKAHERKESLEHMTEEEKKKAQAEWEEQQKKHKDHPKVHHPGSKAQFEEVWEEDDHLDKKEFDPKTFFKLHDLDNDGMWYEDEVRALFQKELDKVYDENASEDDMMERYEEMNRMREHLVGEVDVNKDKIISFQEYMDYVNGQNFDKDEGWDTLDEEPQFTDEELDEYERLMNEEREKLGGVLDGHAQPGEINVPHEQPQVVHMQQPNAPVDQQQQQLQFQQQQQQQQQQFQQQQQQQQFQQQQVNQQQLNQQQVNQQQLNQQQLNQQQQQLNQQQQQANQQQLNQQQQVNQQPPVNQVPQQPAVQAQQVNQNQQAQVQQGQVPQGQVPQGQVPVVNQA